ncbi:histidine phosphotransferase [Vararia minispora EC-137]|uniref:Histidine phosphotransferase n=1 Tax=Vararia minispora EC-137 TaxID=1314806 RepID=A0ACB8QB82_9AGAM|nr:histidine phosphotransferase [Vararia minispora EC-137]
MEVFTQILDLDEDGQYDFSAGMVAAFFSQAQTAFADMDAAYSARDLKKLKDLGHFLKGSAAALGIYKVKDLCEAIQHYGAQRDEVARLDLSPDDALARIRSTLDDVKRQYAVAERWLNAWYADKGGIPDLDE